MDEVLTTQQAMDLLHLSRVELWRQRKAGKLGFCKIGTRIRYQRKHIDAFLSQFESVPESDRTARVKQ